MIRHGLCHPMCRQCMNEQKGLNKIARANHLGRVRNGTAAMIAPLGKPMAIGALDGETDGSA